MKTHLLITGARRLDDYIGKTQLRERISAKWIKRGTTDTFKVKVRIPGGYLNLGRFKVLDADYKDSEVAIGGTIKYMAILQSITEGGAQ
jgi:hypothetical protein